MNNYNLLTGRYKKTQMERQEKFVQYVFWKMVPSIKETGSLTRIKKMDAVFKYGQMVQDTMVFGEMEWQMDTVD